MIFEAYLVLALLFGGVFGYSLSKKEEDKKAEYQRKLDSMEPEYWGYKAHRNMQRSCAEYCKQSGGMLGEYSPLTGSCSCQRIK